MPMRRLARQLRHPLTPRVRAATRLTVLLGTLLLAVGAGAPAAQASFGIASFGAGTCAGIPPLGQAVSTPSQACPQPYTQAGGHPDYAVTSFTLNTLPGTDQPDGILEDSRVDLPPGLVTNPQAVPQCADADFPNCPADTQVGEVDVGAWPTANVIVPAPVYNMVPAAGEPADFRFSVGLGPFTLVPQVDIVGGVRNVALNGQPPDYGEYFTIHNPPATVNLFNLIVFPLAPVSTTLYFFGDPSAHDTGVPGNAFLTLPSTCSGPQTTYLTADSYDQPGDIASAQYSTPVGASGCDQLTLAGANAPTLSVSPVDANGNVQPSVQNDSPTGLRVELKVPQPQSFSGLAEAQLQNIDVTLPPGFSINPAAGAALQACAAAQFGYGTANPITCPGTSVVGSVSMHTPVLPDPLTGSVYLGQSQTPGANPDQLFVDANGPDGVEVRLVGSITTDPSTGQLTTHFDGSPQTPIDDFTLTFNGGPQAVLASPLACGTAQVTSNISPYSNSMQTPVAPATPTANISVVDANGNSSCGTPFAPSVSAQDGTTAAGANTSLTLGVSRSDGQGYLSQITAQLPPGLLGSIASVPQCTDAQVQASSCPAYSMIGTASVASGAGPAPLTLSGPVYLTGPYGGAPYGLSILIQASAGPYNLGTVGVRAGISIDPNDAHLTITSSPLPSILGGIPLRVKTVTIAVNRPGFLFNGTNCSPQSSSAVFGSLEGATVSEPVAPLTLTGCSALAFSPTVTASTDASYSAANGADLDVKLTAPAGQANLRSVQMTLPKQLTPRLTTIQGACLLATYTANPAGCPASSVVGQATAATSVLPGGLTGTVYLVAQSTGLPTLDVPLSGGGVTINLVGSVALSSKGLVTSTFGSAAAGWLPDVPISSLDIDLPEGPHSLLTTSSVLCPGPLALQTVLLAQNGAQISRTTNVSVVACPLAAAVKVAPELQILGHSYASGRLRLKVRIAAAGRVSVTGAGLRTTRKTFSRAGTYTLSVPLTGASLAQARRHRKVKLTVRAGFIPSKRGAKTASVRVAFTLKG